MNVVWRDRSKMGKLSRRPESDHEIDFSKRPGALNKLWAWLYPQDSKYYWYRGGQVHASELPDQFMRFFLLVGVLSLAGSGHAVFAAVYVVHYFMKLIFVHESLCYAKTLSEDELASVREKEINVTALVNHEETYEWIDVLSRDPVYVGGWCILAGVFVTIVFELVANHYMSTFYFNDTYPGGDRVWKSQPNRYLGDKLFQHEKNLARFNSFLSGALGVGIWFYDQHHPFLKISYDVDYPLFSFLLGAAMLLAYIDAHTYFWHYILHFKIPYKYIHKMHHRYTAPTIYSANASHPIEYIGFQSAAFIFCSVFEVHIVAFLCVTLYIAWDNQMVHTGIHLSPDVFWKPGTAYHDKHHELFHVNLGLQFIFWDWLLDTLHKKEGRVYREDVFIGEQDVLGQGGQDEWAESKKKL